MTLVDAFLEEIRELPDDDAPRLIFADWLEENGYPDRAEFIRLQISAYRKGQGARPRRAGELLVKNWERWVTPLARLVGDEPYERWLGMRPLPQRQDRFERGFVTTLTMRLLRFLGSAESIVRLIPLTWLRLREAHGDVRELAACPQIEGLRALEFIDYFLSPLEASDMVALAGSSRLGRLRVLRLYNNHLGDAGMLALSGARWLPNLITLDLADNGISAAGVAELVASPGPHALRELILHNNPIGDEGARLLAQAPWLGQLSVLSLRNCNVSPEAADELLDAAPRLHLAIG